MSVPQAQRKKLGNPTPKFNIEKAQIQDLTASEPVQPVINQNLPAPQALIIQNHSSIFKPTEVASAQITPSDQSQPAKKQEKNLQLKKPLKASTSAATQQNNEIQVQQTEQVQPTIQQEKKQHSEELIEKEVVSQKQVETNHKNVVAENVEVSTPAKNILEDVIVTSELISYFLDKNTVYEIEVDERIQFNSRINFFLNRKYEVNQGKQDTNRGNNSRNYNNNNNNGNRRNGNQGREEQIQRNERQSVPAIPQLQQQSSSNGGIRRGEEDKEVTRLKLLLKEQSSQYLEQMRQKKLDPFKQQIGEIRFVLNILSPTNFEEIKKKLLSLALTDDVLCEYIVEGIIEKARTQKTYSIVYADLCKYMITESKSNEDAQKAIMFKNHLYSNIQATFEGEKDVYNNKMTFCKQKNIDELKTDEEKNLYAIDKKKREMLNVQFIGNLFLNKSMNLPILRVCCGQLLGRFIAGFKVNQVYQEGQDSQYEDLLEALIALFEQTGSVMQERQKKQENPFSMENFVKQVELVANDSKADFAYFESLNIDDYFIVLEWLKKSKGISPKIDSLITNLIQRKNENWKERLSTQTGPVSLENLHKQHQEEMKQSQMELAKYEQDQKSGKGRKTQYVPKADQRNKGNSNQVNGKMDEKKALARAKELWGYLDRKLKVQEDYNAQLAFADFKDLLEQCDNIITFGECVIKSVYDCTKMYKEERLQAAQQVIELLKPEDFAKSFSHRLNKSKDESSDFPLFIEFLSKLFVNAYNQGKVLFSDLVIEFKEGYDESDQEDVLFVYKNFIEDCIAIFKLEKENFDVAAFISKEIDPVFSKVNDEQYPFWVKNMKE